MAAAATRTITELIDVREGDRFVQRQVTRQQRIVAGYHCQSCGSADEESVGYDAMRAGDGYTACCNEIAVIDCTPAHCYHD